jgi:hypothetical protein
MLRPRRWPSLALLALVSMLPEVAVALTCYKIHDRSGRLVYRSAQTPIDLAGKMGQQMRDRWHGGSLTWFESPFCDPLEDSPGQVASPVPAMSVALMATQADADPAAQDPSQLAAASAPVPVVSANSAQTVAEPVAMPSAETTSDVNGSAAMSAATHVASGDPAQQAAHRYEPLPVPIARAVSISPGVDHGAKSRTATGKNVIHADLPTSARGLGASTNGIPTADGSAASSLEWTSGAHTWTTRFNRFTPLSAHYTAQDANNGPAIGVVEGGYLYRENGRELSATAAAAYNFGNNASAIYRKSIDSRLGWSLLQSVSPHWQVGIAGYVDYPLAGFYDVVPATSTFKSKVAAIGPQVGYAFTIRGVPVYANLRTFSEIWSADRARGYGLSATLHIPLGPAPAE